MRHQQKHAARFVVLRCCIFGHHGTDSATWITASSYDSVAPSANLFQLEPQLRTEPTLNAFCWEIEQVQRALQKTSETYFVDKWWHCLASQSGDLFAVRTNPFSWVPSQPWATPHTKLSNVQRAAESTAENFRNAFCWQMILFNKIWRLA
jgi:hypothetical protein